MKVLVLHQMNAMKRVSEAKGLAEEIAAAGFDARARGSFGFSDTGYKALESFLDDGDGDRAVIVYVYAPAYAGFYHRSNNITVTYGCRDSNVVHPSHIKETFVEVDALVAYLKEVESGADVR